MRIAQLEGVTRYLARVVVERDGELKGLRTELATLHSLPGELDALQKRDEEGAQALERLRRQMEEIGAQARGQATRIRMQALRQAVQLAARAEAADVGGGEEEAIAGRDEVVGELGKSAPVERPAASGSDSAGSGSVELFEGMVHMEVGPLRDFSQLVRFEDVLTGIGAATEISVKRFSQGRATLALRLERPIELLRELQERSPFQITVRSLRDDQLIVDVDEAA